jgi:(E)-4-hydroxy-3-methylbut-2-enyl-diphosphate synthase
MIAAYSLVSQRTDCPLHLGVTESGTSWSGTVKSSIGIGALLSQGIGDTLRVSLTTPDKAEEVRVGYEMLKALEIRSHGPMLTSCPGCGRLDVDLLKLTSDVEEVLTEVKSSVKVAVMGCVVNGPGEAAGADLAVVGGKGRGAIYRRGRLVRTTSEDGLVPALVEELEAWDSNENPEATDDGPTKRGGSGRIMIPVQQKS